jgi:indolepyruvate ferredoxin oxidoreductase alpha subunit
VVSVIGDSTFVHSGLTGLVEMVYNPPPTGHLVLILDNGTTAMTGLQEHPGTGRTLDHSRTGKLDFTAVIRGIGIEDVHVIDPTINESAFADLVRATLGRGSLSVIIARRNCLLAAGAIRQYETCPEPEPHA